jgi:murein DD-endopeptidase MepM/ murein hydrolase activator NlpD
MKRIFSRKRRDYRLFAAASAFGFTVTLTALLLQSHSHKTNTDGSPVQQLAATSEQSNTVTFAYASQAANNNAPLGAQHQRYIGTASNNNKPALSMTENVTIDKGDTLDQVFESFGVPKAMSVEAVNSLKGIFSPRQFKIGQQITMLFNPTSDGGRQFRGYRFAADPLRDVIVLDDAGKGLFGATVVNKELKNVVTAKQGRITGSLVGATSRAGVPYSVVAEMIKVYSYNIDFQRDIHEGDSFEVMYQAKTDKDGGAHGAGDMLYARLILGGTEYPIYRYVSKDGSVDFYKADGTNNKRGLMKTPTDATRISSGFGMRFHPILGYNKMHKGIDFAAPIGTPIYAAGDGTIKSVGWVNGYGNFIRINHNATLGTGYGHMSRFAAGIHPGIHVKQGQVIGFVGMTGRTTGPHLHYEILINGTQVNPTTVKIPTSSQLAGAELKRFKSDIANREASFKSALVATNTQTASR